MPSRVPSPYVWLPGGEATDYLISSAFNHFFRATAWSPVTVLTAGLSIANEDKTITGSADGTTPGTNYTRIDVFGVTKWGDVSGGSVTTEDGAAGDIQFPIVPVEDDWGTKNTIFFANNAGAGLGEVLFFDTGISQPLSIGDRITCTGGNFTITLSSTPNS